jgi:hypothetical protein
VPKTDESQHTAVHVMSGTNLYDRQNGACLHLFEPSMSTDALLLKDETELVQRGRTREQNVNNRYAPDNYAVAPVRSGDTLMTIALRYGCKVRTGLYTLTVITSISQNYILL